MVTHYVFAEQMASAGIDITIVSRNGYKAEDKQPICQKLKKILEAPENAGYLQAEGPIGYTAHPEPFIIPEKFKDFRSAEWTPVAEKQFEEALPDEYQKLKTYLGTEDAISQGYSLLGISKTVKWVHYKGKNAPAYIYSVNLGRNRRQYEIGVDGEPSRTFNDEFSTSFPFYYKEYAYFAEHPHNTLLYIKNFNGKTGQVEKICAFKALKKEF